MKNDKPTTKEPTEQELADMGREALGYYIHSRRQAAGLNQIEFAELCGTTQQTVSRWENARMMPREEVYPDIAAALGVDYEYLVRIGLTALREFRRLGPTPSKTDLLEAQLRRQKAESRKATKEIQKLLAELRAEQDATTRAPSPRRRKAQ